MSFVCLLFLAREIPTMLAHIQYVSTFVLQFHFNFFTDQFQIRELEVGVKEQEKIAVQASQQFEYCMMPSDYSFYFLRNWSK